VRFFKSINYCISLSLLEKLGAKSFLKNRPLKAVMKATVEGDSNGMAETIVALSQQSFNLT